MLKSGAVLIRSGDQSGTQGKTFFPPYRDSYSGHVDGDLHPSPIDENYRQEFDSKLTVDFTYYNDNYERENVYSSLPESEFMSCAKSCPNDFTTALTPHLKHKLIN